MRTRQVEYTSNGFAGKVTVTEATVLNDIKRSRLAYETSKDERIGTDPDLSIANILYCSLIAAATEIEINGTPTELSFDEFVQLPGEFAKRWEVAVYDLNPFWNASEESEKKRATSRRVTYAAHGVANARS